MTEWLKHLIETLDHCGVAVLISISAVDGSAPREIGATMVIGSTRCYGTIGGGNLEYQAMKKAGELLSNDNDNGHGGFDVNRSEQDDIYFETYSLGPSLGQCCGGRVELLFQRVTKQTPWIGQLDSSRDQARNQASSQANDQTSLQYHWLARCLDNSESKIIKVNQPDAAITGSPHNIMAHVVRSEDEHRWLYQPLSAQQPTVWLFGAGHVGQAVARQLSLLPCALTWFDQRQEWLDLEPDLGMQNVVTDDPAAEIADAPVDTHFIVMTHSHAIDFDICHTVLRRGKFAWLGLIGSSTKRSTFSSRLKQRGIDDALVEQLRCPIGTLSLESSSPSSVALSVAAELAHLWERKL